MRLRPTLETVLDILRRQPSLILTEDLFLRLLGLIYLISFASFWPQIVGLIGAHGISPANLLVDMIKHEYGSTAFLQFPTLFLFGVSDRALVSSCAVGCLAALMLTSGIFPRIAAGLCWILYLSIALVGQPFSNFQWDALLLESGFLGLFAGSPLLVYAYRFLLFRLMFESGVVKLTSHDPNWANLHALRFHFFTQPLPTPLAYYAARLPNFLLDGMTAATLGIELVIPFLLFGPRICRYIAVGAFVLLQVLIILTGNYAFFNLLTLALCFWGLDDATFRPLGRWLRGWRLPPPSVRLALSIVLIALMIAGAGQVIGTLSPSFNVVSVAVREYVGQFEIVNRYGLFAVMTTTRPEIILEGSDDGEHWREYSFPYKPGPLQRGLPLVAPYQPRLDWQMWFAALGSYRENSWVGTLVYRLLSGEPTVLSLLGPSPFPKAPKYIRALLYEYTFTTPAERARTGAVWNRKLLGAWLRPVSLSGQ